VAAPAVPAWGPTEAAADLARAKDLGATAQAAESPVAAAPAFREHIRERAAKFLRLGLELRAQLHPDFMAADRLVRREVELLKAGPPKWALAQVVPAPVAPGEWKAVHGIL
jgi:hypothetical protein